MTRTKCRACGRAEMTSRVESYRYVESGLPNVVLENIEVRRCASCGHHELVLPRVTELYKAIARAIVTKKAPLRGAEIRYLRKYLGWSGDDFADYMEVDPSTVARWETDEEPMGPLHDRLLRVSVMLRSPVEDYSLEDLKKITPEPRPSADFRLFPRFDGWELAGVAI